MGARPNGLVKNTNARLTSGGSIGRCSFDRRQQDPSFHSGEVRQPPRPRLWRKPPLPRALWCRHCILAHATQFQQWLTDRSALQRRRGASGLYFISDRSGSAVAHRLLSRSEHGMTWPCFADHNPCIGRLERPHGKRRWVLLTPTFEMGDPGQHLATNTPHTEQLPRRLPASGIPRPPLPIPSLVSSFARKMRAVLRNTPKACLMLLIQEGRQLPPVVLVVVLVFKTCRNRLPQGTPILEIADPKWNPHRKIERHQPVALACAFLDQLHGFSASGWVHAPTEGVGNPNGIRSCFGPAVGRPVHDKNLTGVHPKRVGFRNERTPPRS